MILALIWLLMAGAFALLIAAADDRTTGTEHVTSSPVAQILWGIPPP